MINLLPPIAKKKLQREYRLRLGIVVLWAIFFLEIFVVALFAPSYFILSSGTKTLANELAQKKLLSPATNVEIPAQLVAIKKELALLKLSGEVHDIPPSRLINELLANKPQGIEITAVSFAENGGVVMIQFSGAAVTREQLLIFQKILKTQVVESVKFGSSFITKRSPIDFIVTVTFKKQ